MIGRTVTKHLTKVATGNGLILGAHRDLEEVEGDVGPQPGQEEGRHRQESQIGP